MEMEGNRMKMRDALHALKGMFRDIDLAHDSLEKEIYELANSALSAPARQCDVGTAEEQAERFREFCQAEKCGRYRCRSGCKATCIEKCALVWAQTPYEAEEGGAE